MMQPQFFGYPQRALLGAYHGAAASHGGRVLMCAPLLQEGIRSRRALWALAEALSAAGTDVLRFDWYGSGDSGGTSDDLSFDGLHDDLGTAMKTFPLLSRGSGRVRTLAMRCAALPVLSNAIRQGKPADLVLWDPMLDGKALLARWRRQHRQQLHSAGRYPGMKPNGDQDELMGFSVRPALIGPLGLFDARSARLPSGSRLLIAAWELSDELQRFAELQRDAGVEVELLELEATETPAWEDPQQFEAQVFPRRSVNQLAKRLAAEESR